MLVHQSDLAAASRCLAEYGYKRAGLPSTTNSAAAYGSVMHHAIQVLERELAQTTPFHEALQIALDTFGKYWNPLSIQAICDPVPPDGWLPRQDMSSLRARGLDTLRKYADLIRFDDKELLATEYSFVVPVADTWDDELGEPHYLAGSVDRLAVRWYKQFETVCCDDYKTGRSDVYLRWNNQGTAYCLDPMTPILMSDLSWKALGEIRVGERVVGVDEGHGPSVRVAMAGASARRWRNAIVEAAWVTEDEAYELELSNGRKLVASGNHRFLAKWAGRYEWRTVEDMAKNLHNSRRRAPGIAIAYTVDVPPDLDIFDEEYAAGYLSGVCLGDGCSRPVKSRTELGYWSISVGEEDRALIDRVVDFASSFGISLRFWGQQPSGRGWQRHPMVGARTSSRLDVDALMSMDLDDGADPTPAWKRGWLAGLYDTDGGLGRRDHRLSAPDATKAHKPRISYYQSDRAVLDRVQRYASEFGFQLTYERSVAGKNVLSLVGDRNTRASYHSLIRPALARKTESLIGRTVQIPVRADVRVVAIQPVGKRHLVDITTSTGTFIANGVVSHNCYASTRPEFWVGFEGVVNGRPMQQEGFGADRGKRLYDRFVDAPRRFTWINVQSAKTLKFEDGGWRGPNDYRRLALAIEQFAAMVRNDTYPLSLSGATCKFCDMRRVCGGTGVPAVDHGAPAGWR